MFHECAGLFVFEICCGQKWLNTGSNTTVRIYVSIALYSLNSNHLLQKKHIFSCGGLTGRNIAK